MNLYRKIFIDHPRSVNETYWQHLRQASRFGSAMILAGFACLIHGLVPALFVRTGSKTIDGLYTRMVTHRVVQDVDASQPRPSITDLAHNYDFVI